MKKEKWEVKSHSYPIADTGDYDGYHEIVNEKGDGLRTTEDYDNIEKDLQKIADAINSFEGKFHVETACEINLHCENQLLKMERQWYSAEDKPQHNLGVLVFIPDEDNHITAGMWDIENKWVLLDEYRVPECEVTHWMHMPQPPAIDKSSTNP